MPAPAWPSILGQILLTLTSFVDPATAGSPGKAATAAVSVSITIVRRAGGLLMGAAVVRGAAGLLRLTAWIEPVFAVSLLLSGALRGRGDARFPAVMCLLSMWGVRVPLAFLFVFRTDPRLRGVWLAMGVDISARLSARVGQKAPRPIGRGAF